MAGLWTLLAEGWLQYYVAGLWCVDGGPPAATPSVAVAGRRWRMLNGTQQAVWVCLCDG